jgi:putative ABC transport system permease protein
MLHDLSYAVRVLRKSPGFATVATLTIALGIGGCTAIFSVVRAVLLRPLPYADAQRLAIVWADLRAHDVRDKAFSPPDFRDLQLQSADAFEDLAAAVPARRILLSEDRTGSEQALVAGATPNLFSVLGARILVGRDFKPEDAVSSQWLPSDPPTSGPLVAAILSHGFWMRRYGGDPAVIGRTMELGPGRSLLIGGRIVQLAAGRTEIVGVLSADFELLFPSRANMERVPDMWTALRIDYERADRSSVLLRAIGRLKPNVTFEQAQTSVDASAADLRRRFPVKDAANLHFRVVPMHDDVVSESRPAILSLMGTVMFVLLIACANVGNLLIVRASGRARELAVRAAIGGTRWQLVRQMLAESGVMAAVGTLAGVALAYGGVRLLRVLGPQGVPRLDRVTVDAPVLSFAILAGLTTAILCGLLPALRASRADVMDVLRDMGRGGGGLARGRATRHVAVIAELALSFVLLVGAGLMVRTFVALLHAYPGYDPNGVLTFYLPARAPDSAPRAVFKRVLRERLLGTPGIQSVTAARPLPLDGLLFTTAWGTEAALADPSAFREADVHAVLPGYFETLRTPLLAGRTFTDADNDVDRGRVPRFVVIDDILAAKAFPHEDPVGKRLLVRVITPDPERFEIIGVVAHQRHASLAFDGQGAVFLVDGYFGHDSASRWAVRATSDPSRLVATIRAAVAAVDPQAAIAEVQPMQVFVNRSNASMRFAAALMGLFAGIAIVLAAVGLYGVVSTTVRLRTAEIGVRLAFGAQPSSILHLIVGEGLRLVGAGVLVGLGMTFGLRQLITRLSADAAVVVDVPTLGAVAVLFVVVVVIALWLPAQRATAVDPMVTLRGD